MPTMYIREKVSACAHWSRNNLESESSEEVRVTLLIRNEAFHPCQSMK